MKGVIIRHSEELRAVGVARVAVEGIRHILRSIVAVVAQISQYVLNGADDDRRNVGGRKIRRLILDRRKAKDEIKLMYSRPPFVEL